MWFTYKRRKAIMLILILTIVESVSCSYVFDSLANYCANYKHKLELTHHEEIENQKCEPEKSPTSNMRIEEGPNGTKNVFVECSATLTFHINTQVTAEVFDYSEYIRHIIFWETLKNAFETLRNIHRVIAETTICIFCFLTLLQGRKVIP